MKKILIVLLVLAAAASVVGSVLGVVGVRAFAANRIKIKGSGRIVTRTMTVSDFTAIRSSQAIEVVVREGMERGRIEIAADDNLIDLLDIRVKEGALVLRYDKTVKNLQRSNVCVTVPADDRIDLLKASSASRIRYEAPYDGDRLTIDVSSAADVSFAGGLKAVSLLVDMSSAAGVVLQGPTRVGTLAVDGSSSSKVRIGDLECASCSADLSSAARCELSGRADRATVDVSSAAKFAGGGLTVAECSVDASSAGSVRVCCTERLRADVSSGASVRYSGDCEASFSKSSGGSVRKE